MIVKRAVGFPAAAEICSDGSVVCGASVLPPSPLCLLPHRDLVFPSQCIHSVAFTATSATAFRQRKQDKALDTHEWVMTVLGRLQGGSKSGFCWHQFP